MMLKCPYCEACRPEVRRHGQYRRTSDKKIVIRYKCSRCQKSFSTATHDHCYQQKKRHLNEKITELLCSQVSQRRVARILKISRRTVERKFMFLALRAMVENRSDFWRMNPISEIQFDDLEAFEHTKLKPISVTMAVQKTTRKILGFQVSSMPAKGLLARKSLKKYGFREDGRSDARRMLFERLEVKILPNALIESDQNPHYPADVKAYFPKAIHRTTRGGRSAIVGQGELKKQGFDPIFSLNHTFAMLRANVNRLTRKTWCTTKRMEKLMWHLELYAFYHNNFLTKPQPDLFTKTI